MKEMNLSVIIVNYNTKELLKRCLESLIANVEIIVVDNGSTDGSIKLINEFRKLTNSKEKSVNSLIRNSPIIKLIANKQNFGFARAVNQGLRLVRGKLVLLLNSDTQVKKGVLNKLLVFERKVGPAIIGLRMLNSDGTIQGSVFNLPTVKRAIEEFWLGKKGSFSKFAPATDMPVEVEAVSGGAMAISSEILQKIGLFDESYFMYFEDLDFCRRARKAGFKVWYLPEAEIIHEHGASGKEVADKGDQWRRLVPSSKIYYGKLKHYLVNFILWVGQKF